VSEYLGVFRKYAVFGGRATRTEFWSFCIVYWIVWFGLLVLTGAVATLCGINDARLYPWDSAVSLAYVVASFVPGLSVRVRRLHDSGRRGWWALLPPAAFVFYFFKGSSGANRYGEDPREINDFAPGDAASDPLYWRMSTFRRVANWLFLSQQVRLLSVYIVFLFVPMVLNSVALSRLMRPTVASAHDPITSLERGEAGMMNAFFHPIAPSSEDYLPWAFGGMLEALIVPFAGAALVIAALNLIDARPISVSRCCAITLRKWLTLAQFGILWFIALWFVRVGCGGVDSALTPMHPGVFKNVVSGLWATALGVGYALQFLAFVAATVCIMVDNIDPLRAAGFGVWFAVRYIHKLVPMAGWLCLFWIALFCAGMLLYMTTRSAPAVSILLVVASSVVSCYVTFVFALFVITSVARDGYARVPRWLHLTVLG
jgi:uncharacterized membrane protein YhaH (DUF805 family)